MSSSTASLAVFSVVSQELKVPESTLAGRENAARTCCRHENVIKMLGGSPYEKEHMDGGCKLRFGGRIRWMKGVCCSEIELRS